MTLIPLFLKIKIKKILKLIQNDNFITHLVFYVIIKLIIVSFYFGSIFHSQSLGFALSTSQSLFIEANSSHIVLERQRPTF
jgi:hydrogenase-4 membrane subunit HyfE